MYTAKPTTIESMAKEAKKASWVLAQASTQLKNQALQAVSEEISAAALEILAANDSDAKNAQEQGLSPHMIDRLKLNPTRLCELAAAIEQLITLNDPVGEIESAQTLPTGLKVARRRIPLGLIAFICEARPGALVEAAALSLKTGNALIVKCGKEMAQTALALQTVFAKALNRAGLPGAVVTVLPTIEREDLKTLLSLSEIIDLVIPRGGEGLIRFVSENSRIPTLKHYKGVCHLYVDKGADLKQALDLLINGKTQRPSTCNSLEALLVHQDEAPQFLPQVSEKMQQLNVTLKAEPLALAFLPNANPAASDDFGREFLDLTLAVKVVQNFDEALEHISLYGSN
ncbi:MAG: glutamate-5-semialdehyde dehydrogenase, partial [Candidatus Adiutrix sp.]